MGRCFSLLFLIIPIIASSQVAFEATADAESILQGSTFQITFRLKNAQGSNFRPPDFSPFQVISGPSRSSQTSIINGNVSSSMGYVYVLMCNKAGTYLIKEATIQVQGKTLYSKPIKLSIVKAVPSNNSSTDVLIKASFDKDEVFVGEQLTLTFKLYTKVNIQNIELSSNPSLDGFQDQTISMLNNPSIREVYHGEEYTTKVLVKTALFPIKTGIIVVDPAVYRIVKGDGDPFGFGMPSLFNTQIENVVTNELKIKVKELPVKDSEGFSGAVGDMFFKMNSLSKEYSLNDAIHLGIKISGDANFNIIKTDFLKIDSSFEISDNKTGDIIKISDEPKLVKARTYDYLIVPKKTGDFIIKPTFKYYNPSLGRYQILSDSFQIKIIANKFSLAETGHTKDIAPIIENPEFKFGNSLLFKNHTTGLLLCVPLGLLVAGLFSRYSKKLVRRKNKPGEADKEAELTISSLEERLICKAILRCNLPEENHTLNKIKNGMHQKGKETELDQTILKLIIQLETFKFSGHHSNEQLQQIKSQIDAL